ncbi:MAG: DUF305 domain-containing protein [Gammaproteobacteria bacterium]|nr:DUF305 domain-containing protein [Gammaproteobacteria bacterium]
MPHLFQAPRRKRALILLCAAIVLAALGFYIYKLSDKSANTVHPIDSGFARSMLLHHAQAIQMSMMMRGAASPEIQALAQSIIMKQTREMGVMEGWLTAWNEPVMLAGPPMAWVEDAKNVRHLDDQLYQAQCKADGGAMAGIATPEQLEQLKNATGTEKEILFLELMLAHHRAAIPMAWFANRNGESSLVKALASSMIREQGMEIGWIQLKLQQLKKS